MKREEPMAATSISLEGTWENRQEATTPPRKASPISDTTADHRGARRSRPRLREIRIGRIQA